MVRRGRARTRARGPTSRLGPPLWLVLFLGVAVLSLPSAGKPDPSGRTTNEATSADGRASSSLSATTSPPPAPDDPGGTTTTTTAPATTPTAPAEPRELTMVATGDVLLHQPLWLQAAEDAAAQGREGHDFAPIMAGIEPLVSDADLAVCHLETTLAPPEGPFSGYPVFSVPPEIAPALAETGYDACSTASNHIYDKGTGGIERTLDGLDAAGIDHAGAARTADEAAAPTIVTVETEAGAVDVALLSYSYSFNGVPAPDGQEWRANFIDETTILDEAATARDEGAELVVVSLHWGDEYRREPNALQEDLAPRLIGSEDIDLLLGHHAHVVQPVELLDGGWVVYGMGNKLANQATFGPEKAEGLLVRFTFTETPAEESWEVTKAEYTGLLLDREPWPRRIVVVPDALAEPSTVGPSPQRLQAAWERITQAVLSRQADQDGLTAIE